jgi:GH15 family glucan-1,4-alpha-glucosidase
MISTLRCCCPSWDSCPPDDERVKSTVLAIADELTKDGLVRVHVNFVGSQDHLRGMPGQAVRV